MGCDGQGVQIAEAATCFADPCIPPSFAQQGQMTQASTQMKSLGCGCPRQCNALFRLSDSCGRVMLPGLWLSCIVNTPRGIAGELPCLTPLHDLSCSLVPLPPAAPQWDMYFSQCDKLFGGAVVLATPGNHECDGGQVGSAYSGASNLGDGYGASNDGGGECGVPYEQLMVRTEAANRGAVIKLASSLHRGPGRLRAARSLATMHALLVPGPTRPRLTACTRVRKHSTAVRFAPQGMPRAAVGQQWYATSMGPVFMLHLSNEQVRQALARGHAWGTASCWSAPAASSRVPVAGWQKPNPCNAPPLTPPPKPMTHRTGPRAALSTRSSRSSCRRRTARSSPGSSSTGTGTACWGWGRAGSRPWIVCPDQGIMMHSNACRAI